jgi:hypothetical protein
MRAKLCRLVALILTAVIPANANAQVDARARLIDAQHELNRYLADEAEYDQQTVRHREVAVDHLLDTFGGLGIELVYGQTAKKAYEDLKAVAQAYDASRRGDTDAVALVAAQHSLEQLLDQTLQEAIEKLPQKSGLRLLGALGRVPGVIDSVFDILNLLEDKEQRQSLDEQRDSALKAVDYWTRRVKGQAASEPTGGRPARASDRDPGAGLQQLGLHVTTPDRAIREGLAQIAARSRDGYSRADVQIVNRTDGALALNFSGAYLIPGNGNSNSQRLGLVSVIESALSYEPRREPRVRFAGAATLAKPADFSSAVRSQPQRQPVAWFKKHWILLSPRASVLVPFHSVCLDHGRGSPATGEGFYLSDRPLPGRIQRLLIGASLNGVVPQGQVWNTIQQEQIRWYDPRDAIRLSHVHGYGALGQAVAGRLSVSPNQIEWREVGAADDFTAPCSAIREVARNAVLQMGQSFRMRIGNKNYNFIPSGGQDIGEILKAIQQACKSH